MKKKIILSIFFVVSIGPFFFGQATVSNTGARTNPTNSSYLQEQYASESATNGRTREVNPPSPVWTTIKVILYTGIFAVAAYFLIRFIISKGGLPATEDEKLIEIILTKFIGMGSYIQIVKIGPGYYILSLSGDGARMVDKITDQETIDYIELNKENMKPKQSKFFDFLTFFPKGKNLDKMDFLKNQKDRLRHL